LASIAPEALAEGIRNGIDNLIAKLQAEKADMAADAATLVAYARGELDLSDATIPNVTMLWTSLALLYASPINPLGDPVALLDTAPDTHLGVVLAAALGREALAHGRPVEADQLAALAGLSARQITELARTGTLDGEVVQGRGGRGFYAIKAKSAIAWLAERGVPGFDSKRKRPRQ
jgi:hypothetical protein